MKFITLLVLTIVFASCSNQQKEVSHDALTTDTLIHKEHSDQPTHVEKSTAIQLDNGKKWVANKETTDGVNNMVKIVDNAITNNAVPADQVVALETEFKTIFDKCTMTGDAHDQLHNFLLPLKEKIVGLKNAKIGDTSLKEMRTYLQTYFDYFS